MRLGFYYRVFGDVKGVLRGIWVRFVLETAQVELRGGRVKAPAAAPAAVPVPAPAAGAYTRSLLSSTYALFVE